MISVHDVQSNNATNWKKLLPTNCTIQNTQDWYSDMCRPLTVAIFLEYISQTYSQHWQMIYHVKGKGHPATGWRGPRGSTWVKVPDFLDVQHYEGGRLSALRTGRLYPRRNPWYSFSEAELTPGHMVPLSGTTEKIPSDTTRNRSRDRPTSSKVP